VNVDSSNEPCERALQTIEAVSKLCLAFSLFIITFLWHGQSVTFNNAVDP
jgi:hypothetical protein